MTTIHMEPERVRSIAEKLNSDAVRLFQDVDKVRDSARQLQNAWKGGEADRFRADLTNWSRSFEAQVEQLEILSNRVSRETDEWVSVDGSNKGKLAPILPAIRQISIFPGRDSTPASTDPEGFNWVEFIRDETKSTVKLRLKYLEKIGRLKPFSFSWGIFKNNAASMGIGAIFNLFDGLLFENEDWKHALLSTGINTGINFVIQPLLSGILLVSAGVQIVGNIIAGILEATGQHELANYLQNTLLDAIDLNGYVNDISEGIADWILNPQTPNPFVKLLDRIAKVPKIIQFPKLSTS